MARKKRAVALFEVIHHAKPFEQKLSPRPAPVPISRPAKIESPPPKPKTATIPLSTKIAAIWSRVQAGAVQTILPVASRIKSFAVRQGSVLAGAGTAFAVIGVIALVRHSSRPPHPAAPLTFMQSVRAQPIQPSVLQIDHARGSTELAEDQHLAELPLAPSPLTSAQTASASAAASTSPPGARQVNLNYVLVQSYADEKTAQLACDFLNKNGVNCTVERQIRNWRRDFYYVVGLHGFARAAGPDYVAYRRHLDELSMQFAAPHNRYKKFDPMAIKWLAPDGGDPATIDR
jgi:hypothetical protein